MKVSAEATSRSKSDEMDVGKGTTARNVQLEVKHCKKGELIQMDELRRKLTKLLSQGEGKKSVEVTVTDAQVFFFCLNTDAQVKYTYKHHDSGLLDNHTLPETSKPAYRTMRPIYHDSVRGTSYMG
ncbi:hypothetical protein J1N35_017859 [Gossypium stocksii]|uniref:Uncharacterized protein n=1 Tax=Gossypium stocksii TaxID=47602 RepID=A0A9D3VP18_9ROSI|nr:hypothetical protein J1N35_017859 [Gossypium stocksii]